MSFNEARKERQKKGGKGARQKLRKKCINRKSKGRWHEGNRKQETGNGERGRGQGLCEEVRTHGYGLVRGEVLRRITVHHK